MPTEKQKEGFYESLLLEKYLFIADFLGFSIEKRTSLKVKIESLQRIKNSIDPELKKTAAVYREDIVRIIKENGHPQLIKEICNVRFENLRNHILATPLHIAAENKMDDFIYMLIKLGASINNQDYNTYNSFSGQKSLCDSRDTPLHLFVKNCHPRSIETIKFLIAHGADINAENADGWRILDSFIAKMSSLPNERKAYLEILTELIVEQSLVKELKILINWENYFCS